MRSLHRSSSLWLAVLATSCGGAELSEQQEPGELSAAPIAESPTILPLLERIRGFGKAAATQNAAAPSSVAALLKPSAARFERRGADLQPLLATATDSQARTPRVRLPQRADAELSLTAASSDFAVTARLQGARSVEAQIADGLVVYPLAGAQGETWIHRVTADGTEDYFAFERAPASAEVAYTIALSSSVAGLRLVSNTLEFLDGSGVPRLRVAPPYLVDDAGKEHAATLAIDGCAVDRDTAPPWDRATTPPGASSCEIRVSWEGQDVLYPAVLDPAWTGTGNMASARAAHASVLLNNGRVLVAGGTNASGNAALRTAELFDPQTRTWAATGQMASARAQHTATLRNNNTVAVTGGWDVTTVHRSAESYNVNTGVWSALPQMQTARRQHTATLLQSGEILVTGGRSASAALASAERLSTANAWSSAGTMLAAQTGHTATALATGKVLVVGPNSPTAQLYNPANAGWSSTPVQPEARQFHSATAVADGSVIVAGGANGLKSVERYEPNTNTWTRTGSLSYEHSAHAAVRLTSGRVLVVGGPTSNARTATEIFNPTWGTWAPSAPSASVVTPRSAHIAAALNDGKVLVAGGIPSGTTTATASAEIFDPSGAESTASEYRFAAGVDPDVLDDRATELWAVLHRPATLVTGKRYPLLVFLHGNHATCGTGSNPREDTDCSYTDTGTCPSGYVVIPNHRGYDYVGSELAGRGYFVVSINANRGITCGGPYAGDGGLNLARGRLILKHLQRLSAWDRGLENTPGSLGVNLRDRLDFSEVGLMGHSRGGEGVRAAYQQYRDVGSPWPARIGAVNFRGLFEIGPVDGQTSRVLNAEETRWNVLLPACDGDVGDLQGVRPFDRMFNIPESAPFFKSTQQQWGANHNYYNSEWQQSDAFDCANHRPMFSSGTGITGSAEQRQTGFFSMVSFFTANVGATRDAPANAIFDPQFAFRPENPVYRGYHPGGDSTHSLMLEDFLGQAGTSSYGLPNDTSGVTLSHESFFSHSFDFRGARVEWESGGPDTFFQTNWAEPGSGFDLRSYQFLDLRVERSYFGPTEADTTFSVRLVNADGSLSNEVPSTDFVRLPIPPRYTPVLQTARIPLTRFTSANLASVRGARLTATSTEIGGLYLANIRATQNTSNFTPIAPSGAGPAAARTTAPQPQLSARAAVTAQQRVITGNAVRSVRSVGPDTVELTLGSTVPFLPKGQLLVLAIGEEQSVLSSYPQGKLDGVRFQLDRDAWDRIADGETITVRYGDDGTSTEWDFGPLDKALLDR